jgi:predicted nucleic acid-binding protein
MTLPTTDIAGGSLSSWVIDTSALIRLFVPDGPLHLLAEQAFNQAGSGAGVMMAPQLLLVEAANVLTRKMKRGELGGIEVKDIMRAILNLPIRYFDHESLVYAACEITQKHNLSAYDAFYLALAQDKGGRLLTCDEQLDKVAQSLGLT